MNNRFYPVIVKFLELELTYQKIKIDYFKKETYQ